MPKISVLLPVHNGAKYIRKSIQSVLSQSFKDLELIVIDDGSTDGTAEIVKSIEDPRVFYEKNPSNLGIQRSLNRGLALAKGQYIARIDDDDEWLDPEKLQAQSSMLDAVPECALVGTGVVVVDEAGTELFRFIPPQTDDDIRKRMLFKNCFTHSAVLFRISAAKEIGGYSEGQEVRHVEDYDMWLRLGQRFLLANLPKFAVKFQIRSDAISGKNKNVQLRRNIQLIRRYGAYYPHYYVALAFSYIRLIGYWILAKLPIGAKNVILGGYKRV